MRFSFLNMVKILFRQVLILINNVLTHFPINSKQVLFESFHGSKINDNPYFIYKEIIKEHPEMYQKLFWGIKGSSLKMMRKQYPELQLIKRWSLKWVYISATANYWIMNVRMPTWWRKNKGTEYLQTWHGTPLKQLALDMDNIAIPGMNLEKYKKEFQSEASRWNYLIAPNEYTYKIFERAFKFKNTFLKTGYPRNDLLFQKNNEFYIRKLKNKLLGSKYLDKKIITYAPTWRDHDSIDQGKYRFGWGFNLSNLMSKLPEDIVLVIRPHYLISEKINLDQYNGRVLDLRDVDMDELYLITDALITDYSSVMFDYSLLKRPILFFPYDFELYKKELRGFYFDYKTELPGPILYNETDLIKYIIQFKDNNFKIEDEDRYNQFLSKFATWENGTASEQVIEQINMFNKLK